jgi:hypothetical protein
MSLRLRRVLPHTGWTCLSLASCSSQFSIWVGTSETVNLSRILGLLVFAAYCQCQPGPSRRSIWLAGLHAQIETLTQRKNGDVSGGAAMTGQMISLPCHCCCCTGSPQQEPLRLAATRRCALLSIAPLHPTPRRTRATAPCASGAASKTHAAGADRLARDAPPRLACCLRVCC